MRFQTLEIQNLGPYQGSHTFNLANRGVVSIVGKNGDGKSWILDGLLWAGWGETGPRRGSLQSTSGLKSGDVVNEVVGKDALARLIFDDDDGGTYRVTRWRDNKAFHKSQGVSFERHTDGGWITIADLDQGNVQEEINAKLGMDYQLASRVILRSQEDPFNFAQATPKDRFEILTTIEGVGALDDRAVVARERANNLVKSAAAIDSDINANNRAVELYQSEDVAEKSAQWAADRVRREERARQSIEVEKNRLAATKEEAAKVPEYEKKIQEIDGSLPSREVQNPDGMNEWLAHRDTVVAEHAAATAQYTNVADKLGTVLANGSGVCSSCGQAVTEDHLESHRAQLESEASRHQAQVLASQSAIGEADKALAEAKERADQYRASVQQQREALLSERATVAASLNAARRAQSLVDGADVDHYATELREIEEEKDPHAHRAQEIQDRVEAISKKTEEYLKEKEAIGVEAQLLSWWIRHIPSLKSWIFDSVVGEITADANKWLTVLMAGRCWVSIDSTSQTKGGEARDKLGLRCFEWRPDGSYVERDFKKWSGGEKRRISLAVDWALSARLAQRSHANCSFLALDEVDRSLDAEGREALLAALEKLKEDKETVLVVSHDVELQAAPDTKWCVTKDATGSHVEEFHG